MELNKEQLNEVFEKIGKIKHRIARVIGNMEKEKRRTNELERKNVQDLFMAVTDLLNIVEFIYKQNHNDRTSNDG